MPPSDTEVRRDLSGALADEADEGLSTGSATGPAAGAFTLTAAQFQQLLSATVLTKTQTQLVKPRVGGTTALGVWTGYGRNELNSEPSSHSCYRQFVYNDLKALQTMAHIEEQ